jgi:hypothetical protein
MEAKLRAVEAKLTEEKEKLTQHLHGIEQEMSRLMADKHRTNARLAIIEQKLRDLPRQLEKELVKGENLAIRCSLFPLEPFASPFEP